MVCMQCGTPVVAGVNFCARCGALMDSAQTANPAPPSAYGPPAYAGYPAPSLVPRPRVQSHLQTLGILWCVFAAYRLLFALIGLAIFKVVAPHSLGGGWLFGQDFGDSWGHSHGFLSVLLPVIAAVTVVSTALAIFVGYSLINRKPWGRTLAIIAAVLVLLKLPLGTALGIYTLWVLAPTQSGAEYAAIAEPD